VEEYNMVGINSPL